MCCHFKPTICLQIFLEPLTIPNSVKCSTCLDTCKSCNIIVRIQIFPFYSFPTKKLRKRELVTAQNTLGGQEEEPGRSLRCQFQAGVAVTCAVAGFPWLGIQGQSSGLQYICRQEPHAIDILNSWCLPVNISALASQLGSPAPSGLSYPRPADVQHPLARDCICVDHGCLLSLKQWHRKSGASFTVLRNLWPPPTRNPCSWG